MFNAGDGIFNQNSDFRQRLINGFLLISQFRCRILLLRGFLKGMKMWSSS